MSNPVFIGRKAELEWIKAFYKKKTPALSSSKDEEELEKVGL